MKKNKFIVFALYSLVGILFYLLNYYTPLMHDDLAYLYQFGPKAEVRPTNLPVKNLADVFRSQYYHYLDVNGRFTSHFLLQFILLLGKDIFNVFNVFVFLGLIYLVDLYSNRGNNSYFIYLFTVVCLWFLMPFFGQTILWATGAINYLWTSFFVILFLILFKRQKINSVKNPIRLILLFLFSLFIAWMNESITFGIAASLSIYFIMNFKTIKQSEFFMILGFGLGVLLIVFSPGTFNRVGNEVDVEFSLRRKVLDFIAIVFLMKWNLLVTFILLIAHVVMKRMSMKVFKDNFIIILAVVFNSILLLIIGKIEERMLFGNSVLLLVLNVYLLKNIIKNSSDRWLNVSGFCLLLVLFFGYYKAFIIVRNYHDKNVFFEDEIKNTKNGVVYFPSVESSRFVYHTVSGNSDSRNYHNRVRAFYYHVPEVNVLQENLYKSIFPTNEFFVSKNQLENWEKPIYQIQGTLIFEMPKDFHYLPYAKAQLFIGGGEQEVKINFMKLNGNHYTAFIDVSGREGQLIERITIKDSRNNKILYSNKRL